MDLAKGSHELKSCSEKNNYNGKWGRIGGQEGETAWAVTRVLPATQGNDWGGDSHCREALVLLG